MKYDDMNIASTFQPISKLSPHTCMCTHRASMGMHGDMHGDESGAYHADVVTRLYQNHSVSIETKLRRQSEHRDEFYNQYQFQPDISQKSRRLVERSNRFKGSKRDFLTRQNAYQQERQKSETYDRVHHVSEAERQCSFRYVHVYARM